MSHQALRELEAWFVTGSQHLYWPEVLRTVEEHARRIAECLEESADVPVRIVPQRVVTTPDEIARMLAAADANDACIGVVAWMHTFSPAKMWIGGLTNLRKPLVHLHTQFNRDLPWAQIDMDFMNLNQSAHGDREFAFIQSRLGRGRKTIVGHWDDAAVARRLGWWTRAAAADRLGVDEHRLPDDADRRLRRLVQGGRDPLGLLGDLVEGFRSVQVLAAGEKPDLLLGHVRSCP